MSSLGPEFGRKLQEILGIKRIRSINLTIDWESGACPMAAVEFLIEEDVAAEVFALCDEHGQFLKVHELNEPEPPNDRRMPEVR